MGRFYLLDEGTYTYRVGWGNEYTSAFPLPTSPVGRWNHLVAVCDVDKNRIEVYQDGRSVHVHRYTGDMTFRRDVLLLGMMGGKDALNGALDDLMIFGRALTGAEVKKLYSNQK